MLKTTLKNNVKPVTVAVVSALVISLSGCAETSALLTDLQKVATGTNTTPSHQSTQQKTTSNISTSKTEMVGLLGWFEDACGMTESAQSTSTPEGKRQQIYDAFVESFMASRFNNESQKIAYVNPSYQLPNQYRPAIQNISVRQDGPGGDIHYYVDFKNATYRGHDLERLEVFSRPETDYNYQKLYFKNANFMQLKSVFKQAPNELDPETPYTGEFDSSERSIMCYLGL